MGIGTLSTNLDRFLAERDPICALALWLTGIPEDKPPLTRESLLGQLALDVARLDALINSQLNAILHHSSFQRLEASWRGLKFLTERVEEPARIQIRVLSVSWGEVTRDISRAIEFDQSHLFRKIYSEEFGTAGGQPYSVLLADYEIRHRPKPDHPHDDLATLQGLSHIAAAAFAPLVIAAHPTVFGLDHFSGLGIPLNLSDAFRGEEYAKWRSLRDSEDSRFIGMVVPRTLMRLPYPDDSTRSDGFRFREDVLGPEPTRYLWGTAVYALGTVLVRCFSESGWLADIRGVHSGLGQGGMVGGLAVEWFPTNPPGAVPKYPTDVFITDAQEKELTELGFIPLCACKDTPWAAFYSTPSIQQHRTYDREAANINARLSASLQYMLCTARFSHYLKILARDKIGAFIGAESCQDFLQGWLRQYCTAMDDASPEVRARYPLREGRIQVREQPGKPGNYFCVIHLRPHFQLDQVATAVKLVTELTTTQRN